MLSWKRRSASHAVSIAFAVSVAAAQPLLLGSASQTPKTTGSASGSPVPCDEMNVKARALVDSRRTEEARTFLNAAIQACTGAESRSDKERLAAALLTLGFIESTAQPREALQHFRRAMALDPENMRGPQNVGGMLSELNPAFPDTFFNLAAITNDIHHDSRRAMELFKRACDLGHKQACFQYGHFRSEIAALDGQAQGPTVEALAERIRQAYTCAAVVKSTQHRADEGVVTWTVECSGNQVYTVIVGRTGETTVIQKPK
jgi:tetratricopeptide (TPR) repeat protein